MKRSKIVIGILFIIFALLLFEIIFATKNLNEYDNIVNINHKNNTIKTVLSVKYQEQENAYTVLKDYLNTNDGNIYVKYTSSQSGETITTIYTYFTEEAFFKNISLVSGRCFSFAENESDKFLSTRKTNEDGQIGRIADFAGDHIIEIRTLMSKINDPDTNIFDKYLYINVSESQDKEVFYNGLEETMQKYGYTIQRFEQNFLEDKDSYYNLIIIAGLSILYVICMLFIYFDILNSYKKIGIEKMVGFNRITIWKKRIFPLISIQLVSIIITTIILIIIRFKAFNKHLFFFVLDLFGVYSLLVILSALILAIPFITIKKITISNMLKNKNPIKAITLINSVFKVVLSITILIIINNLYMEYQSLKNKYEYSFENWEKVEGYAVIPSVSTRTEYNYNPVNKENQLKQKEIYFYFNERGAVLADFSLYTPKDEINRRLLKDEYKINSITVNPNYLKENSVLDTNEKRIYIDENETEYILLVPESYHQYEKELLEYHEFQKNSRAKSSKHTQKDNPDPHELISYKEPSILPDQNIKIIWTKTNQKMFSYKLDVNPQENNVVKDPIIRVITESNGDLFDFTKVFDGNEPIKIKFDDSEDGSDYIKSVLANYYDPNYFRFPVTNLFTMVEDQIHEFKLKILYNSAIIAVLFGIIFMIILQNVLNYFKQHRVELAIQKFHGFRKIDKYGGYFIAIIIHWLLVLLISIPITRNVFSVLVVSILLITEYIISFLALNRIERVKVLQITKGG